MHHVAMHLQNSKQALVGRGCAAHFTGLLAVGFYGTVGTSGGFGNGAWAGMLVAGVISIPWFVTLVLIMWFAAKLYERHVILACLVGPLVVCGSWWLIDGPSLLDAVAFSCGVSAVVFLTLTFWSRRGMPSTL